MIYTKFWIDEYISNLTPKEKLLFLYLITNERVNLCGIYELPDKYIRLDAGLKQSELTQIKQKFQKDGKFIFIKQWIKIINYDLYNEYTGEKNETAKTKELEQIPQEIIEYQYPIDSLNNPNTNHNQSNNHIKKAVDKVNYADFVTLTEEEHQKLVDNFGIKATKRMIEILDNYKGANGKKYTSDYRAILNWVVKRYEEETGNKMGTKKDYEKMVKLKTDEKGREYAEVVE